jgi:hypothetical protein
LRLPPLAGKLTNRDHHPYPAGYRRKFAIIVAVHDAPMPVITLNDMLLLLPALLLLCWPADWLLSQRVELRSIDSFRTLNSNTRYRPWWWVPALWLDPVRAFAGAWLLQRALFAGPLDHNSDFSPAHVILLGILAVASAVQLFTRREPGVMLTPLGFTAGLALALTTWPVALVATLAAVTALLALRAFPAFFAGGLVTTAVMGLVFQVGLVGLAAAVLVFALPLLVTALTRRVMELPCRNDAPKIPAKHLPPRR